MLLNKVEARWSIGHLKERKNGVFKLAHMNEVQTKYII